MGDHAAAKPAATEIESDESSPAAKEENSFIV